MEKGIQNKGKITQEKERLEDNRTLAKIAKRLHIKKFIRLGRGEKGLWRDGEETILADTMEALIGAIFLTATPVWALLNSASKHGSSQN